MKTSMHRRKIDSPDVPEATEAKVVIHHIVDDVDVKAIFKNAAFLLLGIAWKMLLMVIIIAIIGTALDFHNEWKRASRMAEVELSKAEGTLGSSTCMYFSNLLDVEDKRKWEKAAIDETNAKCVEADIIKNQWQFIRKLRLVVFRYLPWESGMFWDYVKTAFLYAGGVMLPVMLSLFKVFQWFSPIIQATNYNTA